jgi:NAD(P)H-quinone oxidoreductase subunit N
MALITTGGSFLRALESTGVLAVFAPLEGGYEGRYLRRLRAKGYVALMLSARGLGDPAAYLTQVHGMRPAHLGKQSVGHEAAVGRVEYVLPILDTQLNHLPPKAKGIVLWLLEGQVLSRQELNYLIRLAQQQPKLRLVIEMGGDRAFRWQSLAELTQVA